MDQQNTATPRTGLATLGGGCFWCLEAVFLELRGVSRVVSGYAGGRVADPTYQQVCAGATGHAEVVQITYDPAQIAFEDLLRLFFAAHDPTTPNRQGADVGSQYRSIILAADAEQLAAATRIKDEIEAARLWPAPLATEIKPLEVFYPATADHQDYFARNPWSGYCQAVIAPKLRKFRRTHADLLRPVPAA